MLEVPVLIAGGGPVGLSASILLSLHGVQSLLVERHPGTAFHPKARAVNARTMELFRRCGIETEVRAAGLPQGKYRYLIWGHTLAGKELERRPYGKTSPHAAAFSPSSQCLCAQDVLEPVLRHHAERLAPGAVRFHTELREFTQDDDGVTAAIVDLGSREAIRVRGRYLIGADGAQSRIRQALGIAMQGRGVLNDGLNVLLHADLRRWTDDRPAPLYFIEHPEARGTFATCNGLDRWVFFGRYDPAKGERAEDFTPERCVELIRAAAGVPDLAVDILGVAPWQAAARVAELFQVRRVFLAGDAAHEMPPTGGFGMNTGVQDVHNLAWKLAAVLEGWAAPALLDSYQAERRPVAQNITEQSLINSASMSRFFRIGHENSRPATPYARSEYQNEQAMIFGSIYDSSAIIPDGTDLPAVENPITDYVPVARPGSRAPHCWLDHAGARISTLDLFGDGFALLVAGPDGGVWREAGRHAVQALRGRFAPTPSDKGANSAIPTVAGARRTVLRRTGPSSSVPTVTSRGAKH